MQNPSEQYIRSLKELKEKLYSKDMSVLVGSGFSKNAGTVFPSWGELLYDMSREMYENEIKLEYESQIRNKSDTKETYNIYLNRRLAEFVVNRGGFLNLVTEYINLKGFREIVEIYVEKHIPLVLNKGENLYLQYYDQEIMKCELFDSNNLRQHEILLELPWNNAFTTNYDNLLECSNIPLRNEFEKKIGFFIAESQKENSRIITKDEKIGNLQKLLEKAEESKNEIKSEEPYLAQMGIGISKKNKDDADYSALNPAEIKTQINQLKFQIEISKSIIKENEDNIKHLQNQINDCYSVVKHSSELALKRTRNIIKLHGSLRDSLSTEIGFDNDIKRHYILAKEDYDSYPETHEAFTQLMRLSLLQESFCLLGFSGMDPNFLAWVGWVRDIIQKEKRGQKASDKIYLVEMIDTEATMDKELFYKNHRVAHIPLLHRDCIHFLENETGKKLRNDSLKSSLDLFLSYLKQDSYVQTPKVALELFSQNAYKKLWEREPIHDPNHLDLEKLTSIIPELEKDRKYQRIPSLKFNQAHNKETLLFFANAIFIQATSEQKNKLFSLIYIAISDLFLPLSLFNYDEKDIFIVIFSTYQPTGNEILKANLLRLKNDVWKNNISNFNKNLEIIKSDDTFINQEISYQKALIEAFNFKFKNLRKILDSWTAVEYWICKKAGLLAFFNLNEAIDLLKYNKQEILQEELYRLEMLDFLKRSENYKIDPGIEEKIKQIKNTGFKSMQENTDYLIDDINRKIEKIIPYGEDKLSISSYTTISNKSISRQSIQFWGILTELGLPLSLPRIQLNNADEMYLVVKNSFEHFPIPILYYSLQLSNENFIRKVGQDYAYSDEIKHVLDTIQVNINYAYFNEYTPISYKENFLIFYSELLIAIPSKKWAEFYMKVWDSELISKELFVDLRFKKNKFIIQGLHFLQNDKLVTKIIADCIDNLEKENGNTSIRYLYEMVLNNLYLKNSFKITEQDLSLKIINLITSVSL